MKDLIRRHPFVSYYLVAIAISTLVVVWRYYYGLAYEARTGMPFGYNEVLWDGLKAFNGDGRLYANIVSIGWVAINREPIYFGVFLFAGAPTISAILISWLGWGGAGLKRLFARLKPWANGAYRWDALTAYAVIAMTFFSMSLMHLELIRQFFGKEVLNAAMTPFGLPAGLFPLAFLIGGFIDEGATCEEMGWRGFGLPALLDKLHPLTATLILAALWWLWHFPREIPALVQHGMPDGFIVGQANFVLLLVAECVVMTFFFHRTGGSIIPGILIHGWGNFLTKAVSMNDHYFDDRGWLFYVAALSILLLAGPTLGRKRYLALQSRAPETVSPTLASAQTA